MGNLDELVTEIRAEFQIPPYFSDVSLRRLVRESEMYFQMINSGADFDGDLVYRELLKNRVYYAYVHALNDFADNYKSAILAWQAETIVEASE